MSPKKKKKREKYLPIQNEPKNINSKENRRWEKINKINNPEYKFTIDGNKVTEQSGIDFKISMFRVFKDINERLTSTNKKIMKCKKNKWIFFNSNIKLKNIVVDLINS